MIQTKTATTDRPQLNVSVNVEQYDSKEDAFTFRPTINVEWEKFDQSISDFDVLIMSRIGSGEFVEIIEDFTSVTPPSKDGRHGIITGKIEQERSQGVDEFGKGSGRENTLTIRAIVQAVCMDEPGMSVSTNQLVLAQGMGQTHVSD